MTQMADYSWFVAMRNIQKNHNITDSYIGLIIINKKNS